MCCRFPVGNAEYVKQFLLQYSLLRRKEGFVLRHDSLCTGGDGRLTSMSVASEGMMNTLARRMPKHMGSHIMLPELLCTSSGDKNFDLDFAISNCITTMW